jgi:hypothetical protein
MSPSELRTFAKANEVDTSDIDARKKTQLVGLLEAWETGQAYTPPELEKVPEPDESVEAMRAHDEAMQPTKEPEVPESYKQNLVEEYPGSVIDSGVGSTVSGGRFTATVTEVKSPPAPRRLESLTLDDLVGDDDRVRMHVNTFPVTVDGVKKCRLMLIGVPGEEGTLAAVWWVNSSGGPVMISGPPRRVTERSRDTESRTDMFTTEDGEEHTYSPTGGCSTCGNRLANWRPWSPPVRMVQMARF